MRGEQIVKAVRAHVYSTVFVDRRGTRTGVLIRVAVVIPRDYPVGFIVGGVGSFRNGAVSARGYAPYGFPILGGAVEARWEITHVLRVSRIMAMGFIFGLF